MHTAPYTAPAIPPGISTPSQKFINNPWEAVALFKVNEEHKENNLMTIVTGDVTRRKGSQLALFYLLLNSAVKTLSSLQLNIFNTVHV